MFTNQYPFILNLRVPFIHGNYTGYSMRGKKIFVRSFSSGNNYICK